MSPPAIADSVTAGLAGPKVPRSRGANADVARSRFTASDMLSSAPAMAKPRHPPREVDWEREPYQRNREPLNLEDPERERLIELEPQPPFVTANLSSISCPPTPPEAFDCARGTGRRRDRARRGGIIRSSRLSCEFSCGGAPPAASRAPEVWSFRYTQDVTGRDRTITPDPWQATSCA